MGKRSDELICSFCFGGTYVLTYHAYMRLWLIRKCTLNQGLISARHKRRHD
jgi:hypothetical protein